MGGSSAVLRRWISATRRISTVEAFFHGYFRNSCRGRANRMISTATPAGVITLEPPSAPLMLLPPAVDGSGNIFYKFHCLAKNEEFTRRNKIEIGGGAGEFTKDVVFVGSSYGWLALYNRRNSDLFLTNPIADRHIKLPSLRNLGTADRVILSSSIEDEDEEGPLAFMTFGPRRRLAFCSPLRSQEWTLFGGGNTERDRVYENFVYSKRDKRLFCFCEEYCKEDHNKDTSWEIWDVDQHQPPTLDRVIQNKRDLDFYHYTFSWPKRTEVKKECFQMKYLLICNDDNSDSDQVFLVVRHVSLRAGPFGSMVNKVFLSKYRGCHYSKTPYKTIDFDVYKIDLNQGTLTHMEDSLQGLAMFVGTNHPFAIPGGEVAGLKPDSVYFTDDNRIFEPRRLERTNYGGHDNGIFDYQNKVISPCCDFYPIEFEKIRKILPLPMWFRY